MKRELKLNFGELRLVQKRVMEFQEALEEIDEAAAYFDEVLGEQESEAAAVLVERHREMEGEIRYFQDLLSQLESLVTGYIDDMEGYIMPLDENQMMLVDRNDIWWNMKQIGGNLLSAQTVASGAELGYYSGIDTTPSPPHIYEGMSPEAQSEAWERYHRELEESQNRKANYRKLQGFCSGTAGSAKSSLEEFYESLEKIYKEHVIEFENTDDDYKRKASNLYDACTSAGERLWDMDAKAGKFLKDINEGLGMAIYDFISGFFGLAFTLLKIEAAVKVAAVTVPFGITPQWVKNTGKEVLEGVQGVGQILKNPGRALASIGQQVTDTVEEKGIPFALSYVIGDIAIGILVDKGIGKLRGADKADDLVKVSTKADDVAGVADDLDDIAKVVDKVDDVADKADEIADIAEAADKVDGVAGVAGTEGGTRILPQGISQVQFDDASKLLRNSAGEISDDIVVQGSRASGTAKTTSDIDIAIRVSPDKFDELIEQYFKSPNPGSAKERTMLHAIETGKIQAGEAKLSGLRKKLESIFGMEVDVSIIKKGGLFDNPPFISFD